jgi:DNA end-binding protein Ku
MQQLLYAGEVRPISEVEIPRAEVRETELKLAVQLIEQISAERFDPTAYQDEVKKRIEAAVQKKVEGEQISVSSPEPTTGAQVIDLMEALRASLAKTATQAPDTAKPAQRKPPKRAAAVKPPARAKSAKK